MTFSFLIQIIPTGCLLRVVLLFDVCLTKSCYINVFFDINNIYKINKFTKSKLLVHSLVLLLYSSPNSSASDYLYNIADH